MSKGCCVWQSAVPHQEGTKRHVVENDAEVFCPRKVVAKQLVIPLSGIDA
jgi:hypothetical protein